MKRIFTHREEAWTMFATGALSRASMEGRGASVTEVTRIADEMLQELENRVARWRAEEDANRNSDQVGL